MSGGADGSVAEVPQEARQTLLRIKRRRGDAATDEIIVATAQPRADPKRLRMDQMLLQLSGLGMTHMEANAAERQRRQRFRRVTTVDIEAFESKTAGEVQQLVAAWKGSAQTGTQPAGTDATDDYVTVPAAHKPESAAEEAANTTTPSTPRRQPPKAIPQSASSAQQMKETLRDMAMQRSANARYMQVRSRRHAQQRVQQEQQEREVLQSAFHIYDLVCTDVDEEAAAQRAERRRLAKERAAKAATEGAILMNYMPMVEQFLEQQGQAVPEPEECLTGSAAVEGAGGDEGEAAAVAGASAQAQQHKEEDADAEDEFVYDVYLPVQASAAGDMDEDQSVPVVEVEDEEDPFLEPEPSDHDSEDSNAESYYANSYPDEDEYASGTDEDDEGWCHVHQRGATDTRYRAARWDDEEYDLAKDEEDCTFVPHVPGEPPGSRNKVDPLVALGLAKPVASKPSAMDQGEWGFRVR